MEVREPISDYGLLDLNKEYDYWDYLQFKFKERVELIKGKIFKMSPAPSTGHQEISTNLVFSCVQFLKDNHIGCKVYAAPFDVRLPLKSKTKNTTVVQPDICVICDKSKIDKRGCNGAPDLIVEILSKSNQKHDLYTKFNLYEEAGVKEYWIIDSNNHCITIYTLEKGKYIGLKPFPEDTIAIGELFPTLHVDVNKVFEDMLD